MLTVYDQSGNNKDLANCVSNTYPTLQLSNDEYALPYIKVQSAPLMYSYTTTFPNGRTLLGGVDYPGEGTIAIGQVGTCNFELATKRIYSNVKFNIQTCNN